MDKEEAIESEGTIVEALPNAMFHVERVILAGTYFRKNEDAFIRLLPSDNVRIEVSPYDLTHGRITYILK
ncbi:MAG TPA: translation initiation factor IF-1 [Desulfonatronum sp.]|nr:translation initiation factor IF-1 [Desulfonatronum sp.]